jgi:thiamine-monophosphate kinase
LCFTVDPERRSELDDLMQTQGVNVTEIGVVEAQPGLRCRNADGSLTTPAIAGFDHFRGGPHD